MRGWIRPELWLGQAYEGEFLFFFQAEDGIRDRTVTGVQTCALPILIDSRQSYPQEIVKRGVAAIVPEFGETASVHLSYEMVALSPTACEELGIELSEEDRKRPYIEMSGRKGLGVKADDLINRLEYDALSEVKARHPDLSAKETLDTAHAIAVGALRYFLLKFTRNSVIAFDFKEALSFEGETGPYCQYAAVRANSIFRKLGERSYSTSS